MEVLPTKNGHFMPKSLEVKPSCPPPQDTYTQLVLHFNCF